MGFNFPNAPTSGQIYEPVGGPVFIWDGAAWKAQNQGVPVTVYVSDTPPVSPAHGQLWWESDSGNTFIWYADGDSAQWVQISGQVSAGAINQIVLTTSGTYVKPAGLRYLEVLVIGAGGAGGYAVATAAGQGSVGGGGGGGGAAKSFFAADALPASVPYTVGNGGVGGVGAPTAGGASTFDTMTAGGGAPGSASVAVTAPTRTPGGTGGSASGGNVLNVVGGLGGYGVACFPVTTQAWKGMGGGSLLAPAHGQTIAGGASTGSAATGPGGGGGGAGNVTGSGSTASAGGGDGVIYLKEFF